MITSQNILAHELIGTKTSVTASTNNSLIGISGLVVYETKSMLHVLESNIIKQIPKNVCMFEFKTNDGLVIPVDGRKIAKRPEDRSRMIK